jgi:thymidylate kinase
MVDQAKIIIVSGIDGSGKTTIIEAVKEELARQGQESRYVWLRYNHYLTKFLLAFCRLIRLTRYEHFENSRVGYHDFHKSKIISWLFVILTYLDTLAVSVVRVYLPVLVSTKTIICDRWVYDIMIDLEVDTRIDFSEGTLVSKLFKALLPMNNRYFFIKRDFDTVRKARDESMNDRNFPRRYALYEKHSHDTGIEIIDNNGPLEETIKQVVKLIAE